MNDPKYRDECIDWLDYTSISPEREEEASRLDRPLIAQFAGDDPAVVVAAAKHIHKQVSACDLNLGCPQKIAKRGNYGAYLLPQREKVINVLKAMVDNLDCPVTCKIRRLKTDEETLDLCREIESTGVSMLTVHGRTVGSSKLYTGPCDWEIISKIKQELTIPVVANGGISCRDDAVRCLEETGVDGVMSSEALLENPKLFDVQGDKNFRENFIPSQIETVREYIDILQAQNYPKGLFAITRGHLFKMLYRFVDAPKNKDLRETLALGDFNEMLDVVDQIESRLNGIEDDEKAEAEGLLGSHSW